jgi:hypothetical protein
MLMVDLKSCLMSQNDLTLTDGFKINKTLTRFHRYLLELEVEVVLEKGYILNTYSF